MERQVYYYYKMCKFIIIMFITAVFVLKVNIFWVVPADNYIASKINNKLTYLSCAKNNDG